MGSDRKTPPATYEKKTYSPSPPKPNTSYRPSAPVKPQSPPPPKKS